MSRIARYFFSLPACMLDTPISNTMPSRHDVLRINISAQILECQKARYL
jgi:hypothetical protein